MDIVLDRTLHVSFPNTDNSELHDITTGIEAGSAALSEVLFSSGNLQFGAYSSNMFEIVIYGISDVSNEQIVVWVEDSQANRTYLFKGYVDSCKLDNFGYYRQIVAYDSLYWNKDVDVSLWWDNFWTTHTTTATLAQLRTSLCDFIGLTYSTGTYYNDALVVKHKEPGISNLTFSQMLFYICELQCTFPNIRRDGAIEFISLDPTKVTTHNVVDAYEQASSSFEEYQIAPIDRIVVTIDNEVVYRTVTPGNSAYTIDNNLLLYDYSNEEIQSFANAYLREASKISYTPASVKLIVSDFNVVCGDIITTDNGSVYVLSNEYSGSLLVEQTISASGDKYMSEVTSAYNVAYDSIAKKIAETSADLETNYVKTDLLDAEVASIGYLKTANLDAEVANVGYLKTSNLNAEVASLGYLTATQADLAYAEIDLANVNNAWIENGTIKDAAISNEMVNNISANKLTAGTLDASRITVTNLNASNITTGRLTVDGITIDVTNNEASIDGGYIEDGTITLNGFAQEVVDKIDGAIETFTGTVIPTLNNYPASSWTTSAIKQSHIGDVYYVVNSASTADGYCYRFAYDNTTQTYGWVLIKDSDVTKALQELIDVQGDVSDLQDFESTTSSWIINTDDEITSIQNRTTTLETNMGTKVDTSVFNTVSQQVDANTASITTLGTTVSTKADNSTVTTLSNTVNSVQQTTNSNSSTISNLTTVLGTNADGTTASTDIVHKQSALEQDLDGFKTSVSATYATQSTAMLSSTQLWFSKANTTAPSAPTSKVTSTSTAGNTWTTVVPTYNASYPYYFYCYQFVSIDGTTTWSNVVYDQATTESEQQARQGVSDAAIANNKAVAWSATCGTTASTVAKVASCTNFSLSTGATVTVRFSTANTATGALTLNVNSTGAKSIVVNGVTVDSTNQLLWAANANITFAYDGTYWRVVSEPRTWYGACTIAEGTAAKTATINEIVICKGTIVNLNMTYANTNASPTLNITSTGAKNLYIGTGTTRPVKTTGCWDAASTAQFMFDGAYWRYVDNGASTRIKSAESSITQTSEEIALKVSTTTYESGLAGVQTQINSIQVGGRNLILDTAKERTSPASTSQSAYVAPAPTLSDYGFDSIVSTADVFTYSFDYEVTGNTDTSAYIYAQCKGTITNPAVSTSGEVDLVANPTGHLSKAFSPTAAQISVTTRTMGIRLRNASDGAVLRVRNIKLEKGNKETDWTPAPEDTDTALDGIKVGGRNLLNNTAFMATNGEAGGIFRNSGGTVSNVSLTNAPISGLSRAIRVTNSGSSEANIGLAQDQLKGFIVGHQYTESCWVRASQSLQVYLQPIYITSSQNAGNNTNNPFTVGTNWTYIKWTGTLAGTQSDHYSAGYVYAKSVPTNGWIEVCGLKLEEGNKATDWSPSSEDINYTRAVNLLPPVYRREYQSGSPYTSNGITWTVNDDGSVTAKGIATADSAFTLTGNTETVYPPRAKLDPTKRYRLHGCPSGGSATTYRLRCQRELADGTSGSQYDYGSGVTISANAKFGYIYCQVFNGCDVTNGITFYPMLEEGTVNHAYTSPRNPQASYTSAEFNILTDSISSKVSSTDYNGNTIASLINQTATTVAIQASKINLNGAVTANNYFKINTNGSFEANKGVIGNLVLENGVLTATYTYPHTYTSSDVTRVGNILSGSVSPTASDYALYDFDKDGAITIDDQYVVQSAFYDADGVITTTITIDPTSLGRGLEMRTNYGDYTRLGADSVSSRAGIFSNLQIQGETVRDYVKGIVIGRTWSLRKWTSGLVEYWYRRTGTVSMSTWGSGYSSGAVSLPDYPSQYVTFAEYPVVLMTGQVAGGGGWVMPNYSDYSTTNPGTFYIGSFSGGNKDYTINVYATGYMLNL